MARHVVRPSAGISLLLSHHSSVRYPSYPLADCGQPKDIHAARVVEGVLFSAQGVNWGKFPVRDRNATTHTVYCDNDTRNLYPRSKPYDIPLALYHAKR